MYIKSVFSWWFGNVLGQITFTPFLLLIFTRYKELNIVKLLSYGVVYFIFMYIIAIIVGVTNPFVLISFSLIAVIWITIKEGIVFGWFLSIIAAFIASYSIYLNIGAFAGGSLFDNTFNYNFYILIHVFSVLIVGVLFEERKNYEKFLHDRIKEEIQKNNEKQLLLMQENRHAQMGEAISMITHQWKQPLNTLSLLIQSAQLRFSKDKLDKQGFKTFKDNALEQIQYMSETMNDFKNFFKNDKKKQNFSVNDIVRRAVSMVRPIMECDNIELKIDETEYIEYMGYPNNLMQVIINILNNAKDVLNEKNISHKTVNISVADLGGEIHIKIEDNAGGIPEDIINKIFEPYFSTKDKKGTGLGLYMSKIIIEEQMKGKLDVYNSEKGAVFEIILYK
jgi:signal transduction histidine kinase